MYDYAHCLEDAIEGITHSICTLEFENNRELYDWVIQHVPVPYTPKQYEFARLRLPHTVMSKRKLIQLVDEGHVWGWDDPRMPSIAGLRRRGVPPQAIRQFCAMIGVAKANSLVDWGKFEFAMRDSLNTMAPRVMAVLDPLRLTLTNVTEPVCVDADLWPHDVPKEGSRSLNLGAHLWIDRSDFAETPPKGWRRLAPGAEVRLRHGWVVRCDEVIKDASGEVVELRATADLATLGHAPVGRKVRGAIHWVNADDAVSAQVRLIDRLFSAELPGTDPDVDFLEELNPESLKVLDRIWVEPFAAQGDPGTRFQFERTGYFYRDPGDEGLVFNRIVELRDSWAKRKERAPEPAAVKSTKRAPTDAQPQAALVPPELEAQVAGLTGRGLSTQDAVRLCRDDALLEQWENALTAGAGADAAAKLLLNDLQALRKDRKTPGSLDGNQVAALVQLLGAGRVVRGDQEALMTHVLDHGGDPETAANTLGILDRGAGLDVEALVAQVLKEHPEEGARYAAGEQRLLGFFVGACMRASKGRADGKAVQAALRSALG
jgi:glutaminyl-tRNA synthetase